MYNELIASHFMLCIQNFLSLFGMALDLYNSNSRDYKIASDTIIETDLTLNEIGIFLNTFDFFDGDFGKTLFFFIVNRKITFGLLKSLSPETSKCLLENGSFLSQNDDQQSVDKKLFKKLRKKGTFLIISLFGKPFLINDSEILRDFTDKISQEIRKETLIKRKLDRDILLALFITQAFSETHENKGDHVVEKQNVNKESSRHTKSKWNTKSEKGLRVKQDISRISSVAPNTPHSTTPVDIEIILPNDRTVFNQTIKPPAYESGDSQQNSPEYRFPIQATETDAGQFSLEPSFTRLSSARHRSGGNLETPEPRLLIPNKPPRYPDYNEQEKRLDSFNTFNWPTADKPSIFSLAECGFFYTDKKDLVRCHQCGIGLKDWVADDDPLTEHVKHSSSCDFLEKTYGKIRIDRMKLLTEADRNFGNNPSENIPKVPYTVRSPRYQTMEARIASFEKFPGDIHISRHHLAVAGLFYTGHGDLCRCFTCDGGLKDWSSVDDPIKEHATYFPKCQYIIKLKGVEYVEMQKQGRQNNEQTGAAGGNNHPTQPVQTDPNLQLDKLSIVDTSIEYSGFNVIQTVQQIGYAEIDVITAKAELERNGNKRPSAEDVLNTILDMQERNTQPGVSQSPKENLQAMVEENRRLTSLVYCKLCVTEEADTLLLPCTHHRICHECSKDLIFCPICNEYINEKVKTFRA